VRAGLFLFLAACALPAADFATYRGFAFGSSPAIAAKQGNIRLTDLRTVHQRPALIEELDWQPSSYSPNESVNNGAVREGLLRFYNGQLFQMVVTYDRQKVEGLTTADMVESISGTYGQASTAASEIVMKSIYGDAAAVLATWSDPGYTASLIRTGDQTSFALVLTSKRLDALARAAILESGRLDTAEAPQRADALQKRQDEEARLALAKARAANKPNFRP
jgi:hypothetical protein